MPKSSKKKKDKAADFTKARLKLGKGKQQPSNVIDTSFKARYAILGLRELFEVHWDVLESNMSAFVGAIVRLIGDEENLVPHSHLLLLYTTSAQTHIFPEIRIDAVRFLDIFLEKIPEVLVNGLNHTVKGHGQRILDGYLGLLNAGPVQATSSASVTLTPASKYVVLNSLSTFLRHALRTSEAKSPFPEASSSLSKPSLAWYLKPAFENEGAFLEFEKKLSPWRSSSSVPSIRQPWKEVVEDEDIDDDFLAPTSTLVDLQSNQIWTLQNVIDTASKSASEVPTSTNETSFIEQLARTLHSSLVAIFLDYAPLAFSPSGSPSETETGLVITVVQLVRTLYQAIVQKSDKVADARVQELEALLGFMAPYFPAESTGKNIKFVQFVDTYNLVYCELVSFLLITTSRQPSRAPSARRYKTKSPVKLHLRNFWEAGGVGEFIDEKLQGRSGNSGISAPINSSAYSDFLPTIWTFINEFATPSGEDNEGGSNAILLALLDHATKMSSKAASKRLTIDFVARLILASCSPLLRVLQSRSILIEAETITQLQARMAPYFKFNHAVRGGVSGPYCKLPPGSPLRRLVLDMVSVLLLRGWGKSAKMTNSETSRNLVLAVNDAVEGTAEHKYWEHDENKRVKA
ncbi:hypothetical protein CC1G_06770 [Coprinopsis cinerea okayama7|uniref:Pre-rRNA-processing protein Ipi1 N-terminal domain-containing protein n=1 Tax=Coprinopsis cinerea (strain Okayama-7 / 130 / ATCC MYA-4618 / FGSC 9003) TaxID=240176 RepID=A8N1L1_COPC7|nr:hypothetical protein CC1G_06770 [Coprinopsis cinerea okayama7\|eukprot:XP_001828784.2 hypothetical protein CC1G_06770 [Coprinopsis cinerea okayama7\